MSGACESVGSWCRRTRHAIAGTLADPAVDQQYRAGLLRWEMVVQSLEQEAAWHRQAAHAGAHHPVAAARLLARAREIELEFARFLHAHRKEADAVEPHAFVPSGEHRLPPLPYPYDALEPYIDERTMRLHHDKHHQSYVNGLNRAEKMMARARESGDFDLLRHWEREAAFHGAGHYLHTIFWKIMSPHGERAPRGGLAEQIGRDFGGLDRCTKHLSAAAEQVEGGGWGLLVWAPRPRRLEILQAEKHQNLSQWDVIPLLVLDVWEHAYYLKYNNERRAYIDAWWNVVDWGHVADRYDRARAVVWEPY